MFWIWRTSCIMIKANYSIDIISSSSPMWHPVLPGTCVTSRVSELRPSISNKQNRNHIYDLVNLYLVFTILDEPCTKVFNGGETLIVFRAQCLICTNTFYEIYLNSIWKKQRELFKANFAFINVYFISLDSTDIFVLQVCACSYLRFHKDHQKIQVRIGEHPVIFSWWNVCVDFKWGEGRESK